MLYAGPLLLVRTVAWNPHESSELWTLLRIGHLLCLSKSIVLCPKLVFLVFYWADNMQAGSWYPRLLHSALCSEIRKLGASTSQSRKVVPCSVTNVLNLFFTWHLHVWTWISFQYSLVSSYLTSYLDLLSINFTINVKKPTYLGHLDGSLC